MELTAEQIKNLPYCTGRLDAKIVLIGEYAGAEEYSHTEKLPFVGRSGRLLRRLLHDAGIKPEQCYLTNLLKEYTDDYDKFVRENPNSLKIHQEILTAELQHLRNANVFVPIGNHALHFLTNRIGIKSNRGSILPIIIPGLEGRKAIPIIHPATIFEERANLPLIQLDLRRIKNDSTFPELNHPHHIYHIRPTFKETIDFLRNLISSPEIISCDIESLTDKIASIQFCNNETEALCVPFMYRNGESYWSLDEELVIWRHIEKILHTKRLIGQYFVVFDTFMLWTHGFNPWKILNNIYLDTCEGFKCYQPQLPASLDFLTSIYTRIPYYKDEGKEWTTSQGEQEFWTYGCKDVLAVKEISLKLENDLRRHCKWQFYQEKYLKMAQLRMRMSIDGILRDAQMQEKLRLELYNKIIVDQAKLNVLVNKNVNVRSNTQMKQLLYEDLKLPKQFHKDDRTKVTCNEDALITLASKQPSNIFKLILDIRHARTELSNFVEVIADSDNRIRSSFGFTETGRFTSSKNPLGTGYNLQNWPVSMRKMLIPDTSEDLFIEMDLVQAEAAIVIYMSNDEQWISEYLRGIDQHRMTACAIFGLQPTPENLKSITPGQRYCGKRTNHAGHYGIGYKTFTKTFNRDITKNQVSVPLIDLKIGKTYLDKLYEFRPAIKEKFQKFVIDQAMENYKKGKGITLENFFGRRSTFFGTWDNNLTRSLFAWIPQSTVGDLTNEIFRRISSKLTVRNQCHDSLLVQTKKTKLKESVLTMLETSKVELDIRGNKLIIGVEFKVGKNWGEMKTVDPRVL